MLAVLGDVRTLALAVVLVGGCVGDDDESRITTTGIRFVWTFAGQPAGIPGIGCATYSSVSIVKTSGPSGFAEQAADCNDGQLVISEVAAPGQEPAAGDYVFKATYVNLDTGATIWQDGIHATVFPDQTVMADPIVFQPGQLGIVVSWTVNGGMHCPAGGMVTVEGLLSGVPIAVETFECGLYRVGLVGLYPGNYTVDVILKAGGMQAMGEKNNVMVPNSAGMVGPIDITCNFCP